LDRLSLVLNRYGQLSALEGAFSET
jgi:hypothetical protein